VTWHSFRHSLSAWAKRCLTAQERKVLLRHATIKSGEGYGEVPVEEKREIAQPLWREVRLAAQQSLGGAATLSSGRPIATAGPNIPTLVLKPSQSPAAQPSALAFGEGTALPDLDWQNPAL